MRLVRSLSLSAAAVVLSAVSVFAQSQAINGAIEGTIKDASGAVLPGVTVVVRSVDTGAERTLTTNADGYFRAPLLPLGTFKVSVSLEGFKAIEASITRTYGTVTLPTMSTGATDMSYLRAKGMQCYGIGPATDVEDGPKGFAAHSDQERLLESELHRFVRFNWDVVTALAASGSAR